MKISELIPSYMQPYAVITIMAVVLIVVMLRDWFSTWAIKRRLAGRVPHNDDQFGAAFFPDAKRAEIAVRVRRVLAKHLKLPLQGLLPGDRLEDLKMELAADPDLFWGLEAEFGVKTDMEDYESFEKSLEQIVTFEDLVKYVERMMARPQPSDIVEVDDRTYDIAIRCIPILCIGGMIGAVFGILLKEDALLNVGAIIFLSGIALWGLANGGEMLRGLIRSARATSWKEIAAHPWPAILYTALTLFFLWVGGIVLWGIVRNLIAR